MNRDIHNSILLTDKLLNVNAWKVAKNKLLLKKLALQLKVKNKVISHHSYFRILYLQSIAAVIRKTVGHSVSPIPRQWDVTIKNNISIWTYPFPFIKHKHLWNYRKTVPEGVSFLSHSPTTGVSLFNICEQHERY